MRCIVESKGSTITYINGDIFQVKSNPLVKQKKKRNWKRFVKETLIPCIIIVAMEFAFVVYIFHRLGCF
jgi:hypothetical protein